MFDASKGKGEVDFDLGPSEIEQAIVYERRVTRVYFTDRDLGKRFGSPDCFRESRWWTAALRVRLAAA
jgi:hypothetical protein